MSDIIKVNFQKCFEGWEDKQANKDGGCCCNCEHQRQLQCHPWNSAGAIKGAVSKQVEINGAPIFVCTVDGQAISSEHKHSYCEMHTFKK